MPKTSSLRKPVSAARPLENLIHIVRGQKIMLDSDLAELYGVSTKRLNEAVRRNPERFPMDLMFQLTQEEVEILRSQFATSRILEYQEVKGLRSQIATSKTSDSKYISNLRYQFGTSSLGHGGRRHLPYAFTEYGVVMLSSVLNSDRGIQMNLLIVRAFVRMRELTASNTDIAARVEKLERGQNRASSIIEVLAEDIDRIGGEVEKMKITPLPPKRKIGYIFHDE